MCTLSASVHSSKLFGIGWWKFFEWLFLCLHYANKGFLLFWIKLGILIFANKLKWDFDFSIETLFDGTCQCLNSCLNQICCVDEFYKVIFFSLLLTNLNFLAKVSGKQLQKLNFEHAYIFLFEHLMPKSNHINLQMEQEEGFIKISKSWNIDLLQFLTYCYCFLYFSNQSIIDEKSNKVKAKFILAPLYKPLRYLIFYHILSRAVIVYKCNTLHNFIFSAKIQ